MIGIIDYGAGNLSSVKKAFDYLGYDAVITRDKDFLLSCDKIVLPGVGSFGDCMNSIKKEKLDKTIIDFIETKKPFLGICLGLQLLYEESEESENVKGLGILKGKIKKFPQTNGFKIPQIGWNRLNIKISNGIFSGLIDPYVYFVHSYYLDCENKNEVSAECDYILNFHAATVKENINLCQFHPEKSGEIGLKILDNFAK